MCYKVLGISFLNIKYLVYHFPQKSPIISGSFAKNEIMYDIPYMNIKHLVYNTSCECEVPHV